MPILYAVLVLSVLGGVFGLLLGYASRKFQVREDPLTRKVREVLPGANCGGCGYAGCDAYASAAAKKEAKPGLCTVGGEKTARAMSEILGVAAEQSVPRCAHVFCAGSSSHAQMRFTYEGQSSCLQAATLPGGSEKVCRYGCLGFGDCQKACPFGAIKVSEGLAKVDPDLCKACGICVKICPKHLIRLIPRQTRIVLNCSNENFGKAAQEACRRGCIGCRICERNCPEKAISMENNHPVVDPYRCTGCRTCIEKCPYHLFSEFSAVKKEEESGYER